jgi:hypothetical protein
MKHAFDTTLLTAPTDQSLLLCERSYNPPPIRQQLIEILMEELNVPAAFLARDATLACYECGRPTGTVVDIGYHGTTVTPVYEGYVELKGIRRSPIGTKEMDTSLMGHLDRAAGAPYLPLYQVRKQQLRRENFHELARLAVAQDCREEGIGAGVPSQVDVQFQAPSGTFQLPDGTVMDVPAKIRFAVTDLLLHFDSCREGGSAKTRICYTLGSTDSHTGPRQQQMQMKTTLSTRNGTVKRLLSGSHLGNGWTNRIRPVHPFRIDTCNEHVCHISLSPMRH